MSKLLKPNNGYYTSNASLNNEVCLVVMDAQLVVFAIPLSFLSPPTRSDWDLFGKRRPCLPYQDIMESMINFSNTPEPSVQVDLSLN